MVGGPSTTMFRAFRDGIGDLDKKTLDLNQKIEEGKLCTEMLKSREDWSKAGSDKSAEPRRILRDDNIPKCWVLISVYSMGKTDEEIVKLRNDGNFNTIIDLAPPPSMSMGFTSHGSNMDFGSRKHIEEDIIKYLKRSIVGMVSICGMGGVGKITTASRISNRSEGRKST